MSPQQFAQAVDAPRASSPALRPIRTDSSRPQAAPGPGRTVRGEPCPSSGVPHGPDSDRRLRAALAPGAAGRGRAGQGRAAPNPASPPPPLPAGGPARPRPPLPAPPRREDAVTAPAPPRRPSPARAHIGSSSLASQDLSASTLSMSMVPPLRRPYGSARIAPGPRRLLPGPLPPPRPSTGSAARRGAACWAHWGRDPAATRQSDGGAAARPANGNG